MEFFAIFLASLLGSPHCVGMCGGFVALYSSAPSCTSYSHGMYHVGRLLSYIALGCAAGWLGRSVDGLAAITGLQHASAVTMGGLLLILGARMLLQGGSALHLSILPRGLRERIRILQTAALRRVSHRPHWLAAILGSLSGLLPCGWLYTYVAAAGSTASPSKGILVMAIFWLGTIPALLSVGTVLTKLSPKARSLLPLTSALILVATGVWALSEHLASPERGASCHHTHK